MFFGKHKHKIDGKGRLILPSAYRPQLAEGAVVTSFGECIAIVPMREWQPFVDEAMRQERTGELSSHAFRKLCNDAFEVMPDGQGRVLIDADLRTEVGIKQTVVVAGKYRMVELWDTDRWEHLRAQGQEDLQDALNSGRLGFGDRDNR